MGCSIFFSSVCFSIGLLPPFLDLNETGSENFLVNKSTMAGEALQNGIESNIESIP